MKRLLAGLVLVGLAGPAFACLNDVELPQHEREFRSSYLKQPPPPPPANPSPSYPDNRVLFGVGGLLAVGAIALAFGGRSRS